MNTTVTTHVLDVTPATPADAVRTPGVGGCDCSCAGCDAGTYHCNNSSRGCNR